MPIKTVLAIAGAGLAPLLPPSALGATDTITATSNLTYTGGSGPSGEFLADAGTVPAFVNSDLTDGGDHNVVADGDGPDGEPLFETPLLDPGAGSSVPGAQYLDPGAYPFICTIHIGMSGTLLVSGPGTVPRPAVELAVLSRKLGKVQNGELKVRVTATTQASEVSVVARLRNRLLAGASGLTLAAGESRKLTLKLNKQARRSLADLGRAKVKLSAEVPYGSPAAATRTLK